MLIWHSPKEYTAATRRQIAHTLAKLINGDSTPKPERIKLALKSLEWHESPSYRLEVFGAVIRTFNSGAFPTASEHVIVDAVINLSHTEMFTPPWDLAPLVNALCPRYITRIEPQLAGPDPDGAAFASQLWHLPQAKANMLAALGPSNTPLADPTLAMAALVAAPQDILPDLCTRLFASSASFSLPHSSIPTASLACMAAHMLAMRTTPISRETLAHLLTLVPQVDRTYWLQRLSTLCVGYSSPADSSQELNAHVIG